MRIVICFVTMVVVANAVAALPPKPLVLDRDITGTVVLKKTKKPHQVARSITVRPTGKLLIERGAEVRVAGGAGIMLMAPIEVVGEGDERVLFTARDQHRAWAGFTVGEKAKLELSDFTVSLADYGFKSYEGRRHKVAKLTLKNSVIVDCETGVKLGPAGDGTGHVFENCRVLRCRKNGFEIGYYGQLTLDHVSVLGCGETGVLLADRNKGELKSCVIAGNKIGLATDHGQTRVSVTNCAFVKQREWHVDYESPLPMQARDCFWGDVNPATIARGIQDGFDLPARGQVDFAEFLTEPPEGIGASLGD